MDKLLRNSAALRIIALIMACLLWLSVNAPNGNANSSAGGIAEKFTRQVQVEVSQNTVATSQDISTATIQVRSTMQGVLSLSNQMANVQLVADAEALGPGKHTIPVMAVGMPNVGNTIVTISPSVITVVLEKKVSAMKPVKVLLQGHPIKGANVGTISVDNPTVQVSGSNSVVSKVAEVEGTVPVYGASSSVTKSIALTAVDKQGKPVTDVGVTPSTVNVTIPIQTSIQSVGVLPQIIGQPADGLAVSGVKLSVTSAKLYGVLNQPVNNIMVPIDVNGMKSSGPVKVQIPLLPGIDKADPESVTAEVTIEPMESRMFTDLPIQVLNLPSGMKATFKSDSTVSVRVSGPKSIVDGMAEKDVIASVDGSSFKNGDNTGIIKIQLPNWVNATELSTNNVTVQVS